MLALTSEQVDEMVGFERAELFLAERNANMPDSLKKMGR